MGMIPILQDAGWLLWMMILWQIPVVTAQQEAGATNSSSNITDMTAAPTTTTSSDVCTSTLEESCARCGWGVDILETPVNNQQQQLPQYNCSLPGLEDFAPGGQYQGVQANYLSFVTTISSPHLPARALEFETCTGGRIVFSEAANVWEDPVEDLGTQTRRGNEIYDGYFMSYSHFPEVSALGLAEPLNDRIRRDNARLKWEDVLPKVKKMGVYRHKDGGGETQEFLMYDGDFFVPIIRLDLLEKHNLPLPNTWEELVDYVKFFNGTDLNDDGIADDVGFCHFPRLGAGNWDWWFSEAVYSTWATISQTQGTEEGFFFDEDTMEPRFASSPAFRKAADIWKDLWTRGVTSESDMFLNGRCAIGFAPPGSWKRIFLTPNGVHRTDANGTVIWRPTMKNGDYAEPYRFRPFGSLQVVDKATGVLQHCTRKICPKAEPVPVKGHHGDDDRASVLPPSPLEGQLINRAPFYWSGGLGTLIRKSAPKVQKDLIWDFFVYTNSPATSVYDVANYRSWLDSWRFSQLVPGENFLQAGWSENAYREHADVMQWALSKEVNGAFNLRLPAGARYTRDVVGTSMNQYIDDEIDMDQLINQVTKGWIEITEQEGKLDQLEVYRSSLGLRMHSEVELCRLHRDLMDERDPSVCRNYDETDDDTVLLAVLIPVAVVLVALLIFLHLERKRRKETDLVWNIDPTELHFDDPPRILGQGTFGYVLKAEYRGTEVAVKRFGTQNIHLNQSSKSKAFLEEETRSNEFAHKVHPNSQEEENSHEIVSPIEMGQTLSVKASKAMVEIVKTAENPRPARRVSRFWRKSFLKNDAEYNKQKAEFVEEIKKLSALRHQCVITIMGAVLAKDACMIVLEYMDHGSLYDVLHNETMMVDGEIILPILRDIAQGIRFLHAATPQIVHCDLKSSNILVDGRFRAKVADFGLSTIETDKIGAAGTPYFLAPEVLRGETANTVYSDAYAFGMVIFEAYGRQDPYVGEKPLQVLRLVADKSVNKRPPIPPSCPPKAQTLMTECLCSDPRQRPTFEELDLQLKRLDVSTMEPIRQQEKMAVAEQARNESLLYDLFPEHVADALRDGRKVEPQSREHCTIFSSEICDFSEIASALPPVKVADLLHRLYSKFDDLCGIHDVWKVETINDAFMGITGLIKDQPDHAKRIAEFSIGAVKVANETLIDVDDPSKGNIDIKAGLSSGPVLANVVGTRNPRYCLFGDAVNSASNLEALSERNRIHCSEMTALLLEEQCPSLPLRPRGLINIKGGKGEMFTFFVNEDMDQLGVKESSS